MAGTKVKGVIVESRDYKEKDKVVGIYTLENGLITAVFKGVRGEKSKLKSSKEIFTFADFFIEKGKGFDIVTQVDMIESFHSLSQDLDKYYEACSILSVVKILSNNQSNPELFIGLVKSLKFLAFEDIRKDYVLIKFLIEVFKLSGYPINLAKCSSCKSKLTGKKFFNFEFGEIVCSSCKNNMSQEISTGAYATLKVLSGIDFEKLSTVKFSTLSIAELKTLLCQNFQHRFGKNFFVV